MLAQIPRFYIPTVIRKPLLKTEIDVSFSEIGFSPTPARVNHICHVSFPGGRGPLICVREMLKKHVGESSLESRREM
jgi:hypothetical protein